jgi:hypothetical protein
MYLFRKKVWSSNKSRYIDLTVKTLEAVGFHLKISSVSFKSMVINISKRWIHLSHLFPIRVLQKPPDKHGLLWHFYDEQFCIEMDIPRLGACPQAKYPLKTLYLAHYQQKMNPVLRTHPSHSLIPSKRVNRGFAVTWEMVRKYLLCKSSCHTPSSMKSLNSHMLSKLLFLNSNTSTPRPPWSLGRQIIFHNLYFFLCSSLCQKNREP